MEGEAKQKLAVVGEQFGKVAKVAVSIALIAIPALAFMAIFSKASADEILTNLATQQAQQLVLNKKAQAAKEEAQKAIESTRKNMTDIQKQMDEVLHGNFQRLEDTAATRTH